MISRSRPPDAKDIGIEVTLKGDELTSDDTQTDQSNVQHMLVVKPPLVVSPQSSSKDRGEMLQTGLKELRRVIIQEMPIRLLYFQQHNSKLKISLLEKSEIYKIISLQFRNDFYNGRSLTNWIPKHVGYAILSHTWTRKPGEMTYDAWQKFDVDDPKCRKLINFCKAAYEDHRLTLGWIDTICINKESSAELDESIRSMYAWYSKASVCITYLAETASISEMPKDSWFTRGWTLQELVAPPHIKFYDKHWRQLIDFSNNDKEDPLILDGIERATTIRPDELVNIRGTSISRRMQLAAMREVTRVEDSTYSLMGIFNISISTAYGEGAERAFFRFLKELFDSTKDVSDLLNWGGEYPSSWTPVTSLFPSKPVDFIARSSKVLPWYPIKPLTLTHLGLRTLVLLMPAMPIDNNGRDIFFDLCPFGDYYAGVDALHPILYQNDGTKHSNIPEAYYILDKRCFEKGSNNLAEDRDAWKFGTLNIEADNTSIYIPKTCLAVLLRKGNKETSMSTEYRKVYTYHPIVFELEKRNNVATQSCYRIAQDQLGRHGMQLATLYL
ncbi:hypothetical protein BDN70DRAFT_844195 [Pholiota conissans]|uniref:Heterokaryon incompatibility domain-containing protein n=1 Tax=Pholiota conissans TaxID=109636 RepID=A0A9P6CT67_9AGAR|nr:hypothetical protein BDN70DRAFT_844195 [Pholiota conissans]